MLAVLIMLTPGCRNKFIGCQTAKVHIAVLPIIGVKARSNSSLKFPQWAYQLRESTSEWVQNPEYTAYRPMFTTQDEWRIEKYVMEVLK